MQIQILRASQNELQLIVDMYNKESNYPRYCINFLLKLLIIWKLIYKCILSLFISNVACVIDSLVNIIKVTCKVSQRGMNQGAWSFFERISYEELVSLSCNGGVLES